MELINKFRCQFIEKKGEGEANHKLLYHEKGEKYKHTK